MQEALQLNPRANVIACLRCRQRNLRIQHNNHVRCWQCHANMCYKCRQLIQGKVTAHYAANMPCQQHHWPCVIVGLVSLSDLFHCYCQQWWSCQVAVFSGSNVLSDIYHVTSESTTYFVSVNNVAYNVDYLYILGRCPLQQIPVRTNCYFLQRQHSKHITSYHWYGNSLLQLLSVCETIS